MTTDDLAPDPVIDAYKRDLDVTLLEAMLERVLIEPFSANYRELLGRARERVRDRE